IGGRVVAGRVVGGRGLGGRLIGRLFRIVGRERDRRGGGLKSGRGGGLKSGRGGAFGQRRRGGLGHARIIFQRRQRPADLAADFREVRRAPQRLDFAFQLVELGLARELVEASAEFLRHP